jgi:hypothetical protein
MAGGDGLKMNSCINYSKGIDVMEKRWFVYGSCRGRYRITACT